MEGMKNRLKEIEEEASALREMQAKFEKEMSAVQGHAGRYIRDFIKNMIMFAILFACKSFEDISIRQVVAAVVGSFVASFLIGGTAERIMNSIARGITKCIPRKICEKFHILPEHVLRYISDFLKSMIVFAEVCINKPPTNFTREAVGSVVGSFVFSFLAGATGEWI